jgi:ATP synthase protein I
VIVFTSAPAPDLIGHDHDGEDMLTRPSALLRSPMLAVAMVTGAVAVVASILAGFDGLVGAVLGGVLVVVFFGADHVLRDRTRRTRPEHVMALALAGYAVKVLLLALLLVLLGDTTLFSRGAFAAAILLGATAWLAAEVRAFARARILYVEPHDGTP